MADESKPEPFAFQVKDRVIKRRGDYTFEGEVRSAFRKTSGVARYVVQDDRGLLFIFSANQLERLPS